MVGHESVDPKPQAKADLVTGVICAQIDRYQYQYQSIGHIQRDATQVKAKGNPVLIPEPGCGYVRDKTTSTLVMSRSR